MKKKQLRALHEKTAKFLIDITKYMVTAVLISSILKDASPLSWIAYTVCILLVLGAFVLGLYYTKKKEE